MSQRSVREAPPTEASPLAGAELAEALSAHRGLYELRPGLTDEAATRAIIAEREASAAQIAARIGSGGPEAARAALGAWRATPLSREGLLLIEGLSQNDSEEAVAALEAVYAEAELFRMREEVLRALGRSEAEGRNELLVDVMRQGLEKESQVAAGALRGEEEAIEELVEAVSADLPMGTRLEAIHSIGGIGSTDAESALVSISEDARLEERVRQYARAELDRSFPS
jgi:HEAT repeat protein